MSGSIKVVAGCMFAGKSEELLRLLKKARYKKKVVVAFKPDIDTRSGDAIKSHDGGNRQALSVSHPLDAMTNPDVIAADVVGIDEAQFFHEDVVAVCLALSNMGKQVIVAGLDLDFRGIPFGPMPQLLAIADEVVKLHAACTVCGADASRSQRIVPSQSQVLPGGSDAYEARCRKHWNPDPVFAQDERDMSESQDG